jgi:hypothetical protein
MSTSFSFTTPAPIDWERSFLSSVALPLACLRRGGISIKAVACWSRMSLTFDGEYGSLCEEVLGESPRHVCSCGGVNFRSATYQLCYIVSASEEPKFGVNLWAARPCRFDGLDVDCLAVWW